VITTMDHKIVRHNNLAWHNISKVSHLDLSALEKDFRYDPHDLAECLPPAQRAKVNARADYIFMILQFPVYNRTTRKIYATEVDFFITPNTLTLIHQGQLPPIDEFFELCSENEDFKKKYFNGNPATIVYEILNRLLTYCFPMLNHISNDIDNLEQNIFDAYKRGLIQEILSIKLNIVNFKKAMQSHKNVIKHLAEIGRKFFPAKHLKIYFAEPLEKTKDIWENLDNYSNTINAIHESYESLISAKTNDIMKTLTIFSVIVFPLTLLASIFGMNTLITPVVGHPQGFWIIVGAMTVGTVAMFGFFKYKKWI
jgi:magnesium transporter